MIYKFNNFPIKFFLLKLYLAQKYNNSKNYLENKNKKIYN
jgi:hypothetical protein